MPSILLIDDDPDLTDFLQRELCARGQPNAGRIALTIFRDKVRDLTGA